MTFIGILWYMLLLRLKDLTDVSNGISNVDAKLLTHFKILDLHPGIVVKKNIIRFDTG